MIIDYHDNHPINVSVTILIDLHDKLPYIFNIIFDPNLHQLSQSSLSSDDQMITSSSLFSDHWQLAEGKTMTAWYTGKAEYRACNFRHPTLLCSRKYL